MPANTVYLCDGCGKNLTTTDHLIDYRMRLTAESIMAVAPKVLGSTHMPNPLAADAYFCGWPCLEKWLEKRRESNG